MIIKCEKHGEVDVMPNPSGEVQCPTCLSEILRQFYTHTRDKIFDSFRVPTKILGIDPAKPGEERTGITVATIEGKDVLPYITSVSIGCSISEDRQDNPCGPERQEEDRCQPQYEDFLLGLKRAGLIESYRMTGEDTAEVKMLPVRNWINKLCWERLRQG